MHPVFIIKWHRAEKKSSVLLYVSFICIPFAPFHGGYHWGFFFFHFTSACWALSAACDYMLRNLHLGLWSPSQVFYQHLRMNTTVKDAFQRDLTGQLSRLILTKLMHISKLSEENKIYASKHIVCIMHTTKYLNSHQDF